MTCEPPLDSEIHDAPLLAEVLPRVDDEQSTRVLDLGQAVPSNLDFFVRLSGGIRIADLLRDLPPYDKEQPDDTPFIESLARLAPPDGGRFDLILAWDLLDRLASERVTVLAHHLSALTAHGGRLHAMISTTETIKARPTSYEIVEPGRLRYRNRSSDRSQASAIPAAEVERRVRPFRVFRSVLLRHGFREMLAILD